MKKSMLFIFLLMTMTYSGCISGLAGERGDGNIIKEERKVASFDAIEASGGLTIKLVKSDLGTVEVTTDANLMDNVETYVRGNTLYIDTKNVRKSTKLEVRVHYQKLDYFDLSGAVDVYADDVIESERLTIDASGASEMELELDVRTLDIDVSGASDLVLSGKATRLSFEGSGASSLKAGELETENCYIDISGAGDAWVHASNEIKASVSGAGSIRYSGNPVKIKTSVSGAGSVKRAK